MRKAVVWFMVWFARIFVAATLISSPKERRELPSSISTSTANAASLIAIFDNSGFRGTIEFHSNPTKNLFDETLIRVNVVGSLENFDKLTWSIWERPTDLTREDPCSAEKLGTKLVSLSEVYGHISTGNETFIRDTFELLDVTKLFERTLVIASIRYGLRSCALIRSTVPLSWTAEARFISPIGGTLVIRHLAKVATGVRATFLWTSGKKIRNAELHWSLVRIRPDIQRHQHEETLFRQRSCSHLWELMASDQTVTFHTSKEKTKVRIGGRGAYPVATGHTYNVETNFTSLVASDLTDLWVILRWSIDEFVACAPLLAVEPRETIATFQGSPSTSSVRGYVHFYQASGYGDATVITVNLTTTNGNNAAGFGIDELTIWPATSGVRQQCLDLSLSYFNPLRVDTQSSPLPSEGTTDRYAVGDLSGKMGSLSGQSQFQATFYNQYVSLFGSNGLIGRSVVIYEDNWYPLACSNLVNEQNDIMAIAKYQKVLDGEVVFRQRIEGPLGADTSLLVHLRHKDETNSTNNHMWQIHSHGQLIVSSEHFGQRRTQKHRRRLQESTARPRPDGCGRESSVFNPYAVSGRTYGCDCRKSTDVRCALGDLGNRLGAISSIYRNQKIVGHDEAGGQLFVDTGLFLNGDFSVVGLTLVIYESEYENQMLDCATIELFNKK